MLQKEFEQLTGIKPSVEEFDLIHAIYMNTALDKNQFCEDYKKHHISDSEIVKSLHAVSVNYQLQYQEAQKQLSKEQVDMTMFLIEQAEKWSATDLREKAISIIGIEKYLSIKLAKGYNLWELDRKAMIDILNNK